jgi:LEA14-like dessication related protein
VGAGAALALAAAGVAGCSLAGRRFAEPEVQFRGVTIRGLGLTGGSLDLVLDVYNPNGFALDASRMTYRLWVDTLEFASGTRDDRFRVEKGDTSTVTIPVDFKWAGMSQAARELLNTGTVNYRVAGDITVGSALGNFTIPYDRKGRFSALSGTSR